ncbi:transcription termination factor 5, mitochondrial [Wyeomyia smithii]|uniref:transcription termination factor 5, mitochondrial n=1 Tax=Wyeomyia smithii TaxID=174621 RepID=UPI00246802CE|nr:transcription termination factor 5, mitochondrial [Wyeomyia smithii]
MFRTHLWWYKNAVIRRFLCTNIGFANANQAAKFYAPLLDLKEPATMRHLVKNEFLVELDKDDVKKKIKYLKYLNATGPEILRHAHIMMLHLITLENRATILRESGFVETLTVSALAKYLTIVRQSVKSLKLNRLIPKDLDMIEQLKKQFDISVCPNLVENDDQVKLQELRKAFLTEFLKLRLDLSDDETNRLFTTYWRMKHRSFGHTQRVLDILQNDYNFSRDKIIGNFYLLCADPENLARFPEVVPAIAETSIKDVISKQPKIAMVQCEKVHDLLNELRKQKISEKGILIDPIILTLSPDTIRARLKELQKHKEFEVFFNHPRIIKLIAYQTKASIRLDFLRQLKVRCASLNVLSGHSKNFERYVRDGYDRTMGQDTWHYLNRIFKQEGKKALSQIKLHPNWYHVPVVQLSNTYEYLTEKGFVLDSIFENVQILLYPRFRIESKLQTLLECKKRKVQHDEMGLELASATPSQILALCLYLIEVDFHFTGDGVWPEENQHSDAGAVTNIKIPNTLQTVYKYGRKPPELAGI